MSLTTTTLASACAASDTSIVVTSATGFAARSFIRLDAEVMQVANSYTSGTTIPVRRGQEGTAAIAHPITANVTVGTGTDFANPADQTVATYPIAGRARLLTSYTGSGAITLPTSGTDAVAILNGTGTLAMTLADPGKDIDGSILWIVSNGKVAYTVTSASGFGAAGGSYDVATGNTSGNTGLCAMAANGVWILLSPMTGTLTNAVPALA